METIYVAVGSTRAPKLEAVRQALAACGAGLLDALPTAVRTRRDALDGVRTESETRATPEAQAQFEVVGVSVPSGVGHTPQGRAELMAGARGRALALAELARERREPWRYFVGLEGGVDVVHDVAGGGRRWVFLENWAYVRDTSGREAYGQAGGILLPDGLAERVVDRGVELSEAIDTYAGGSGIRDAQGGWGVLTRNLITRQDAYRIAVIQSLAPFFNRPLYP